MTRLPRPFIEFIVDAACRLQQIPSPTFFEEDKASFLIEQFTSVGLREIHRDRVGNVYGCLPGGNRRPLVMSAHMDTVHPAQLPLPLNRTGSTVAGPAIGDNSIGLASLLGLIRLLKEKHLTLPGDIWFIGNVCEEGLGDLRGMRAIVDHFGPTPIAYLVIEGMGLGQIYHRGLGVERYRITARTAGGHSWVDYGKPSAIHQLAALVTRLVDIPVPRHPRTTLNVGIIQGGTSINTIAAQASLELDLRSEDSGALKFLAGEVHRRVADMDGMGVQMMIEVIGLRPAGQIPANHPLVRLAENCLREEGITPHPEIASTDANVPLSHGLPAVCIGITTGSNAHTSAEYIDIEPIQRGIGQLLRLVSGVWLLAE